MARRTKIPDPLRRRHLLENSMDSRRAAAVAEAYLAEGRRVDAIAFLRKAEDRERLAALRDAAAEEGHVFLLRACAEALGEEPGADLWERTARSAAALGRERDAAEAERQAARLRS